jgi:hypothetical protein
MNQTTISPILNPLLEFIKDTIPLAGKQSQIYYGIAHAITSNNPIENSLGAQGILKWTQTGHEPESPGPTPNSPPTHLGHQIRQGFLIPTDTSIQSFTNLQSTIQSPQSWTTFPGHGDLTLKEIQAQDFATASLAATFQSGRLPTFNDTIELQFANGAAPSVNNLKQEITLAGIPIAQTLQTPQSPIESLFGTVRMLAGALTGDTKQIAEGFEQAKSVGLGAIGISEISKIGTFESLFTQFTPQQARNETIINEITDSLLPSRTQQTANPKQEPFQNPTNRQDLGQLISEPGDPAAFAKIIAANLTYKKARHKGLSSLEAGELSVSAGSEAFSLAAGLQQQPSSTHSHDQTLETLKTTKHFTTNVAATITQFIPGIGTALSSAIRIADMVTDMMLDRTKDKPSPSHVPPPTHNPPWNLHNYPTTKTRLKGSGSQMAASLAVAGIKKIIEASQEKPDHTLHQHMDHS